jgi:pilus assembly protein CpaE
MHASTILLASVHPSTEARLRALLPDVEFVALPSGRGYRETVRELGAPAAVVSLDADAEPGFRLVRELAANGVRVLVLGPAKDPDLILRAMREGAKEFELASDHEGIARALRERVKPPQQAAAGRIYAVFPAKGGVGGTTLATNLAGALQRRGERTCLVDLNLNMGDVLAFLDLPGGYSISDVIANMRRLDRGLLDSTLLRHASGVHVLAQSHRIEEADRVEPVMLSSVLAFLRQHYGATVLDGLRSFDDVSVAAVDASDLIVLVVTQEVPAVRDAHRCVELFRRLGAQDKLRLVVNRYHKGVEITPAVIAENVGLPVAATVANDYPAVIRAINRGQLLFEDSPRAQVTMDVEQLVRVLGHGRPEEPAAEKGSLLRRFFSPRTTHAT